MSYVEYLDLIEKLRNQKFDGTVASTKQILLFAYKPNMHMHILNGLLAMQKNTKWNVIVNCLLCPVIPGFSLHRIIPTFYGIKDFLGPVKDLVRNPDFKKMELIRRTKWSDKRLSHLENTTIYIENFNAITLSLVYQAALISYNTREMGTKIIIYETYWDNTDSWEAFLNKYPLLKSNFQIENKFDLPTSAGREAFYDCKRYVRSNGEGKSVVLFYYSSYFRLEKQHYERIFNECKDRLESTYNVFKYYDSHDDLMQNFMGHLLDENLFPKN